MKSTFGALCLMLASFGCNGETDMMTPPGDGAGGSGETDAELFPPDVQVDMGVEPDAAARCESSEACGDDEYCDEGHCAPGCDQDARCPDEQYCGNDNACHEWTYTHAYYFLSENPLSYGCRVQVDGIVNCPPGPVVEELNEDGIGLCAPADEFPTATFFEAGGNACNEGDGWAVDYTQDTITFQQHGSKRPPDESINFSYLLTWTPNQDRLSPEPIGTPETPSHRRTPTTGQMTLVYTAAMQPEAARANYEQLARAINAPCFGQNDEECTTIRCTYNAFQIVAFTGAIFPRHPDYPDVEGALPVEEFCDERALGGCHGYVLERRPNTPCDEKGAKLIAEGYQKRPEGSADPNDVEAEEDGPEGERDAQIIASGDWSDIGAIVRTAEGGLRSISLRAPPPAGHTRVGRFYVPNREL